MKDRDYYNRVADYYDADAGDFEKRYWQNPVLQRVRQAMREEVKRHPSENILEIGFGTGLDVCHFAAIYPERRISGIDISPQMHSYAEEKIRSAGLSNVTLFTGAPENLSELFPDNKFDMVYVFFGALNTASDLRKISGILHHSLSPGGKMVLTFVNKWYAVDIVYHLLKLNPTEAFRRFRKVWGGYSNEKPLESRCYSAYEVKRAFRNNFAILKTRGYSILYPAWYRYGWLKRMGDTAGRALWRADVLLSRTFFWSLGEYAQYTMLRK